MMDFDFLSSFRFPRVGDVYVMAEETRRVQKDKGGPCDFGNGVSFLGYWMDLWCRHLILHRAGLGFIYSFSFLLCYLHRSLSFLTCSHSSPSLLHPPFAASTRIHTHPQAHSFHHGLPLLPRQRPSPTARWLQLPV